MLARGVVGPRTGLPTRVGGRSSFAAPRASAPPPRPRGWGPAAAASSLWRSTASSLLSGAPPPARDSAMYRPPSFGSSAGRPLCPSPARAAASASPPPARTAPVESLQESVTALFGKAIQKAFPEEAAGVRPAVAPCQDPKFGDFQCNNAMALFGRMKGREGCEYKSPRAVAEAIIANLPESSLVAETSVAGPGFINIGLARCEVQGRIDCMLKEGLGPWAPPVPGGHQRVVVDFSSPNVAKEMHVGHLRSTIIGDTLCNVLNYCGADVVRINHVGDWGTQFGMLIEYLRDTPEGLQGSSEGAGGEGANVGDLQAFYKAAKARFDEDEDFKRRAQKAVVGLQGGDPASLEAWRAICSASRKEFNSIYERLGVTIEERGESFYNDRLEGVVADLTDKGVAVLSDGAMCVFEEGDDTPLIVRKSDGGFNYASTDLAAIKQRIDEEKAGWIIYVTDSGQQNHFKKVFGAAKRAGYIPPPDSPGAPRVDHVAFGLVMGEDGKRFRTRSGEVVRLVELLDEAVKRCRAQLEERRGDMDDAELDSAARAMGYGAVKYADLHNNRASNYTFSFDSMLNLKGNTAVYLLYAHARIASIVRKSGKDVGALVASGTSIALLEDKEWELGKAICLFPEAVRGAADDLMPNRLCDYLYDLSGKYNEFYTTCQVIGSEEEDSRLLLCEATAVVMRQCFQLLGITPLYRI